MPIDLQTELTYLRRSILSMGALVEQRVHMAIDGLLHNDLEAAMTVKKGDDEVDAMEVRIEEACLRILALSHPVAKDLRFVLAVMRINNDLERIGDLARSVAKRALHLGDSQPITLPSGMEKMANATRQMLADSLASLTEGDVELARRIRAADKRVDDLLKEIFAWVQTEIPRHVEATKASIDILSVARRFERISDLATNIAEDVIFLIEGELVRHSH